MRNVAFDDDAVTFVPRIGPDVPVLVWVGDWAKPIPIHLKSVADVKKIRGCLTIQRSVVLGHLHQQDQQTSGQSQLA
jgi:hypothetical protein